MNNYSTHFLIFKSVFKSAKLFYSLYLRKKHKLSVLFISIKKNSCYNEKARGVSHEKM